MPSKYIDLSTVKFFMNNVQELETVLEKERFVDHNLESINLYVDSVKQFADRELAFLKTRGWPQEKGREIKYIFFAAVPKPRKT